MLTQARLKEVFHYDQETGIFTRLVSLGKRKKGDIATYTDVQGYIEIGIDGVVYLAHRLAWLYVYGEFPKEHTDHIDGVKNNNRISNLRDVSCACNQQNQRKARKHNKLGFLGVSVHKKVENIWHKSELEGSNVIWEYMILQKKLMQLM